MTKESDDEMWGYPPHTKAKHDILHEYLNGWYGKLSAFPRVLFFDGFAGRGIYTDGSEGSPLIALRAVLEHPALTRNCVFEFLFVERDDANRAILEGVIAALRQEVGGFPANIVVRTEPGTFEEHAGYLATQSNSGTALFAFVDPFGYSGIPMETIVRMTKFKTAEVFVNLMVDFVGRFVERDGQQVTVEQLFGLPAQTVMAEFNREESVRHEHLRDLYIQQLRVVAGFPYVSSFAMKNDKGHVGYYLLHGSRHPDGIKLMKAAMWKVDDVNGGLFSDRDAGSDALFPLGAQLHPLKKHLIGTYAGQADVCLQDIKTAVMVGSTQFRETHVVEAVKELEGEGHVTVRKKGQAHADAFVTFK